MTLPMISDVGLTQHNDDCRSILLIGTADRHCLFAQCILKTIPRDIIEITENDVCGTARFGQGEIRSYNLLV